VGMSFRDGKFVAGALSDIFCVFLWTIRFVRNGGYVVSSAVLPPGRRDCLRCPCCLWCGRGVLLLGLGGD